MFSALNLHTVQLGLNYRHKYQYYKLDIAKRRRDSWQGVGNFLAELKFEHHLR